MEQIEFPKHPELAEDVAAFLKARNMHPTDFGKAALNDSALITKLKRGRELRQATIRKIRLYMLTGAA